MSGFTLLVDRSVHTQGNMDCFARFTRDTAEGKQLEFPSEFAIGHHCLGAKLDSPVSFQRGVVRDDRTGSWLLVCGSLLNVMNKDHPSTALNGLLNAFLRDGASALNDYDGHFGLVIYDGQRKNLFVISDPMGLFSIYYAQRGTRIFIGTSALAIAKQIDSTPDRLAMECFLRTGRVFDDRTLWCEVRRLPAATIMDVSETKLAKARYWLPQVDPTIAQLTFTEALESAQHMFADTFQKSLAGSHNIWTDLTGGIDSRFVTMLLEQSGQSFISNCVGPNGHPDVEISRQISRAMNWPYRQVTLPQDWADEQWQWFNLALHRGDAALDVVQLAGVLYGHRQKLADRATHVLGLGGENWRGFYWQGEALSLDNNEVTNYDYLVTKMMTKYPAGVLDSKWTGQVKQALQGYFEYLTWRHADEPKSVKLDGLYLYHRHPTHSGAYLSAAAGSVRTIIPLCFKTATNFALSINRAWKMPKSYRFIRSLLAKNNPTLANMMTTNGGPAAPIRLTNAHQFSEMWFSIADRAMQKLSHRLLKHSISLRSTNESHPSYPLPEWRRGWLDRAEEHGLLSPKAMCSAKLYNLEGIDALTQQAKRVDFAYGDFLGRVLTIEMAMRETNISL